MNSPALDTYSHESDDGAELSVPSGAELPTYCLYFLVCADESGPLAGLVKVGIADCFPVRYRQHTRTWGQFDLSRSALLRVRSRREAQKLEQALRNHFGDPVAESVANAGGKTLTSEDFIAMGSWRRYPGRRDDGFTEFYALAGLARILSHVEDWRKASDERRAGTRLQRGISPAECSMQGQTADPSLTRAQSRELREHRRAAEQQFAGKVRAESNKLIARVLGFALEHQEHLIGVDLRAWRKARATRDAIRGKYGLVSLYFRTLEDVLRRNDPRLETWWAAQHSLQKDFAPVTALAHAVDPNNPGRRCIVNGFREGVGTLVGGGCDATLNLPRPVPLEMVWVCAGNCYSDPFHLSFGTFEKLEQMVEGRRTCSQTELRW